MLACNYSNDPRLLQVSGMFVVVLTAMGCLYFFDSEYTGIASKAGLQAVGVLLMVTNAVWVLLMVWLIVKAGLSPAKQLASSTVKKVKAMLTTRTSSGQPLQSPTLLGIQVPSP